MAKYTINQDQTTSWQIDESSKTWTLAKNASLSLNMTTGIYESALQHDNKIVINGDITVTDFLKMNNYQALQVSGTNTKVTIGKDSTITSDYGLSFGGANGTLINNGVIDTVNQGVAMYMGQSTLTNSGSIDGNTAVTVFGDQGKITNLAGGEIHGSALAIAATSDKDIDILNDGLIQGTTAIITGDGKTHLTNTGRIVGDIDLGGGNDVFDNRGGKFNSTVEGGAGNDTYYVSKATTDIQELFLLGGTDSVKSTVTYAIKTFVENVTLLGNADIDATGSAYANVLKGNVGDNKLVGLGGGDTLNGGTGNDRLVGGADADLFVFKTGDGHDIITDFKVGAGDVIDLSQMSAIKSYSDLVNHHLEVSGKDLLIVAGDDQIHIKNFDEADLKATLFDI